jgi:nucleotide-binding universal stress UspA family protein
MKVEKILFPTDFSEGSYHALPYAVDLSKHYSAKLYIIHVIYDIFKATDSHIPHVSADELYREPHECGKGSSQRYTT